jgi:hypothetical protein
MGQNAFATAGGTYDRPLFALMDGPIQVVEEGSASQFYGNPLEGKKWCSHTTNVGKPASITPVGDKFGVQGLGFVLNPEGNNIHRM